MSAASTAGDSRFDGRYNGSSRPFQPPLACSCCSVALILTLTNSEPKRASSGGVDINVIFARPRHLPPGPTREAGQANLKLICRSEEHTSELQSLLSNSYHAFCYKKKTKV